MTVQPIKTCQIKRDYPQLINLYPATATADARYPAKLRRLLSITSAKPDQDADLASKDLQVLGLLGFGDGKELLILWHAWQQSYTTAATTSNKIIAEISAPRRLLIKLFEPTPFSAYELKMLWDQHPNLKGLGLTSLATQIINAEPARIIGCQRLIFDDGRFIVDLHFGDVNTQLNTIPDATAHAIKHWHVLPYLAEHINAKLAWQMARVSEDAAHCSSYALANTALQQLNACGFDYEDFAADTADTLVTTTDSDDTLLHERHVLRKQAQQAYAFNPLYAANQTRATHCNNKHSVHNTIAIIGGGLASAHLALSLAERGQSSHLFCQDSELGQGASGNRQGAIYPLLTPENDELSRFFQQAFLFSRRRIQSLIDDASIKQVISHAFCGVLQTAHDERSQLRLDKIMQAQDWPNEIAYQVDAKTANELAKISIDKAGFFYPLGGWVCPFEYAKAALEKAAQLTDVVFSLNEHIIDIEHSSDGWYLRGAARKFGPFTQLILANGAQLTQFDASHKLQISPFRGQVSHVPAKHQLSKLATVLCANGYLTPSHQGMHCLGASYIKSPQHLDFSLQEQVENLDKMHQSYPKQAWLADIDMAENNARVGVRMVTRDHFPMMGCAPDVPAIVNAYKQHQLTPESRIYWQTTPAPVLDGLYILGGLGSRGLSSGPLAAECLAAQLCGEPLPMDINTLCKLNPNRMWLRKLLKGKAL